MKTRTIFPFGTEDSMQDQYQCECGEWVNMEDSYEAMDGKFYCEACGEVINKEVEKKKKLQEVKTENKRRAMVNDKERLNNFFCQLYE